MSEQVSIDSAAQALAAVLDELDEIKEENERLKKAAKDYRLEANIQRERNSELDTAHKAMIRRVETLKAERDELLRRATAESDLANAEARELDALRSTVAQIAPYCQHLRSCAVAVWEFEIRVALTRGQTISSNGTPSCTCGLADRLAALNEPEQRIDTGHVATACDACLEERRALVATVAQIAQEIRDAAKYAHRKATSKKYLEWADRLSHLDQQKGPTSEAVPVGVGQAGIE